MAVVARTNNLAEQFFSQVKRKPRRQLRCAHLGRDQPAQAALAANLLDPICVEVVCGTLYELPHAFAALVQAGAAQPDLDRNRTDADLRRCIRKWVLKPDSVPNGTRPHSAR